MIHALQLEPLSTDTLYHILTQLQSDHAQLLADADRSNSPMRLREMAQDSARDLQQCIDSVNEVLHVREKQEQRIRERCK